MKILVTGGAGFIGYHLINSLLDQRHKVTVWDNFNSVFYSSQIKQQRAQRLISRGAQVNNLDLLNKDAVNYFMPSIKPDMVVHLAAYSNVRESIGRDQQYIENNILATQNLIIACERNQISDVVYASTSCVMHGQTLPWQEDINLGPQLCPYGYSKMCNEQQFNLSQIPNTVGLRLFTSYGPWGRPDMAVYQFTQSIINNCKISVFNHGEMWRDFTYVNDTVAGIQIVMQNMSHRDIYNIGTGKKIMISDVIYELEYNLGIEARIEYVDSHPADVMATHADINKISLLGYRPQHSLRSGIFQFVNWYRNKNYDTEANYSNMY